MTLGLRLESFTPNAKQLQFCQSHAREVFLTGPNQYGGKTYCLRFLTAVHATGRYPDYWQGPRFDKPIIILCFSKNSEAGQRQMSEHLFSEIFELEGVNGQGWVPADDYNDEDFKMSRGITVSARIDHHGPDGKVDGRSAIYFLSYDMGWRSVAGYTADLVIGNETPPLELYTEMKARINATQGRLLIGACPLEEEPVVYYHFKDSSDGKHMELIEYTIDDCTHLTQVEYDDALARWKNHPEAEARLYGRPCRAGGLVFGYKHQDIICGPRRPLPTDHGIIGLDLPHGVGHFAAVLLAYDKIADVVYATGEFKSSGQEIPVCARRVALMGGDKLPVAWPHDGGIRTGTGESIADKYKACGLNMLRDAAHYYDGSKRCKEKMPMVTEAQERLSTGRLKISQSCPELLREMQAYRYRHGKIILMQEDHLIDALLKGLMMLRFAEPFGGRPVAASPRRADYDFYGMS